MILRKQDELLWGAAWLHWASDDISYMSYIQSNGNTLGAQDDDYSFSWDDKRIGTKVLLAKVFFLSAHSESYLMIENNNKSESKLNLLFNRITGHKYITLHALLN